MPAPGTISQRLQLVCSVGLVVALAQLVLATGLACGPRANREADLGVSEPAPPLPHSRGLWVLCEGSQRVLEDLTRISALIDRAQQLQATDLFVQVYRGGRAWYAASLTDASPYQENLARAGTDPLRVLIARAHEAGLRVHAWVNVLSLSSNRNATIVQELGREVVMVDRRGRSLLDYPKLEVPPPDSPWYRMGTRGVYLDPAHPGVGERLTEVFAELVTVYPELDGLHLDYIRHPGVLPFVPGSRFGVGLDFGYGEASRRRFGRETGLPGPFPNGWRPGDPDRLLHSREWDDWRRDKVTELVARIRSETRLVRPDLQLSAAVISYVDRAYLSLAQDWRGWLEDELIDFAVPMVYTKDDRLLRYQAENFARSPVAQRIWIGLGTWLFAASPDRARTQVAIARAAGAVGEVLFSDDAIAASAPVAGPSLLDALIPQPAQPPEPVRDL